MSGEHAPLPPSSAPQWGRCSGSVLACAQTPNVETEENRKGTAAHWVGSEVLEAHKTEPYPITPFDLVGRFAPNGVIIDEEMAEGVNIYVEDVLTIARQYDVNLDLLVERRVHAPQIHPQNWGTLDAALMLLHLGRIFLWDYKNGHRENSAFENLQMIDYLAGLIHEFGINGLQDQQIVVTVRIVQPFCYKARGPIDEWSFTLSDLRPYINQLHGKAHEAFSDPKLSTGPWCRDCPAVRSCGAARRAGYNLIDYANLPYEMDVMSPADLAVERKILSDGLVATRSRLEAIEDELQLRISQGASDTGLALESSPGRQVWTIPDAQAIAFASQFGADIKTVKAKTPAQATAAVPREMRLNFKQAIKSVTHRPPGGLKLVDAADTISARAFKRKT